jgi:Fe-S-cluster-containing dehydrogenase component
MDQNDLPGDGPSFRHVAGLERGTGPEATLGFVSLACQHCGDAPCVMACPTGALSRSSENGIVLIDRNLCVGCHSCALVCPFGAPHFPEGHKMNKCDFCRDRLDHGLEPACVRVCPTGALGFGALEEITHKQADRASQKILASLA